MDLDELRAFVAVVETGSMARASRALGFARATLQRRIDELEARVGVPLLERSHAGVTPTAAGGLIASQGRRVLQDASALLARARNTGSDPAGMLHMMLPVGLPPEGVAFALQWLQQRHVGLTFEIGFSPSPLSEVLEGVDLVVFFGGADDSPGAAWITQPLLPAPQRLLASPSYLAEHGTPRTPEDLKDHALLLWQAPGPPLRRLSLDGRWVERAPLVVSADVHGLLTMAAMGMGIACVPEGGIVPMGTGALDAVLTEHTGPAYHLAVATPKALTRLPKVQVVLEAAEESARLMTGG